MGECNRTGGSFSTCLRSDVAAGQAPLLQILLVIFLGGIELYGGHNLRRDRLGVAVRLLQGFLRGLGLRGLFGGVEEDRGSVLRAPVWALTVQLRGIVVLPKDFEQVGILYLGWVELDLHGFGMSGPIGANFLVSWTIGLSAGVADAGGSHARNLPEGSFDSPKTSCCKGGFRH